MDCASTQSGGYFTKYAEGGTPFDVYSDLDSSYVEEDILLNDVSNFSFIIV